MKNILFTIGCLCAFQLSFGKIYKVKTAEEFNKAAVSVLAGDEIVIANGNYSNWATTINCNGTVDKPIIIRAESSVKAMFSGEVRRPVFQITGTYIQIKGLKFEGCQLIKTKGADVVLIQMNAAKYCRITDCTFTKNTVDTQFMPIVVVSGRGEHNRVDHCQFTGNVNNQEIQVKVTANDVSLYTLIDHNVFMDKDSVIWKGNNGGECVQIGQDPILLGNRYSYTTVRDNRFIHCNGEPEVISNKSSGNQYINNYFENCHGELVMRGGHECLVDSNTFAGGIGGIRVNGTGHTITNNSFKNLPIAIRLMYGMAKGKIDTGFYIAASDCIIKNNYITHCDTGILIGGSKNADWTGKFDTKRYPSRTIQDVAPFNNHLDNNTITDTKTPVLQ
ncbi:polysaccharide lyase 6 family protein [Mucilaginibacter aquariorum]|uniref:Polysaccharide lyase 6 family protein n=1 Tax=Mucilaginibacter aquariorum TaxID=2967225 RepID=A0ABT1T2D4_9SPHI|nr:polysaccharide lyase 6 family protein [Mucilaginibacter aquariorum]MCQ6958687.1 polysaccharide lyase 6 family protein [Mucilaginibacter aquariorum]